MKLTRIAQLILKYQFMLISRISENLARFIPENEQDNYVRYIWMIFASILLIPLIVMSMNRGILPVDDIAYIYGIAIDGDVVNANNLFSNFIWNFFDNPNFFRPVSHFIFNIQHVVFSGDFWLFYVVKWISKLLLIWVTIKIAKRLDISAQAQLFIASFILFHPTIPETRIFSSDSWYILFYLAFLWLMYFKAPAKSVLATRLSWLLLLVLWVFFLGSKETAVIVGGIFLALVGIFNFIENRFKSHFKYQYAALLAIYLIYLARFFSQVLGRRELDYDFILFAKNLKVHFEYLFSSPMLILAIIFFGSIFFIFQRWKEINKSYILFFIIVTVSSIGLFILSSMPMVDYPRYAALRYVSPLVPIVALIIAYGAKLSQSKFYNLALLLLAFIYPIWQSPNIYAQYTALDNTALEFSTLLRFSEPLVQDGYSPITTKQPFEKNTNTGITIGGEIPGAFLSYFQNGGKILFNKKYPQKNISSTASNIPKKWVLFTAITPSDINNSKIQLKEPFAIFKVTLPTERYSISFQSQMSKIASLLGSNLSTFYDDGNIPLLNENMFYLYISCSSNECMKNSYGIQGQINNIKTSQRIGSFL
jgi:hypothetical protein